MEPGRDFKPRIIGFLCNWCCYGGADLCGVSRFQYPPYLRVIRVMCSGRVDLKFILRAFSSGADGVFVGGCHLNDCHYNPEGNYDALIVSALGKCLLRQAGVAPERLRLEWVSAGEGIRFAEIMNRFGDEVKRLGPLGGGEGQDPAKVRFKLASAERVVPYIKLVERERLRVPVRSEAAYQRFLSDGEVRRMFDRAISDKVMVQRLVSLLAGGGLTAADIAGQMETTPSAAARYVAVAVRQGVVRYDGGKQCYVAA